MSTTQLKPVILPKTVDTKKTSKLVTVINIFLVAFSIIFLVYGIHKRIFFDQTALSTFLKTFGIWAPIIFVLYQGIQVIFPILPGNLGCVAGVIIFGPWYGFLYNYIGIVGGSLVSFLLARRYGMSILKIFFKQEMIDKYLGKISNQKKFDTFFALAILLPVAPDDFLCYLAGLTKMTFNKYSLIILLGKPAGILAYSLTLQTIFHYLFPALI